MLILPDIKAGAIVADLPLAFAAWSSCLRDNSGRAGPASATKSGNFSRRRLMTALNEPVAKRIAKLFRSLSSDFDGEVLGAVAAMKRLFAAEGLSFHDIATVIESCNGEIEDRKYSDADAKTIFERGIAKGRAEQQDINLEFSDGDGRPRWYDMAVYCQRNAGQLRSPWEKKFVADIAGKVLGTAPSPKQARCILKIFVKLGGYCDPKIQPPIFSNNLSKLPIALQGLTKQRRWVVWRWVPRTSKNGTVNWTKPPYQPAFPNAPAKSNAPSTWGSYQEALAVVAAGKADGIGVMLLDRARWLPRISIIAGIRPPANYLDGPCGSVSKPTARAVSRGHRVRLRLALHRALASGRRAAPAISFS